MRGSPARTDNVTRSHLTDDTPLILVCNDDSIHAPGIEALAEALEPLGEVWVIAPDREQSAVGHGISLETPLRCHRLRERWYSVSGTPADCVYFAVFQQLSRRPAIVVSGINRGFNLSEDVLYSGTIAAAIEGCLVGIPSMAVSLDVGGDYAVAGVIARDVAAEVLERGLPPKTLLSLNVPKVLKEDWKLKVAPLGRRAYKRQVIASEDPRGRAYYWIGGPEISVEMIPNTDCTVVYGGDPCLTPLSLNMTDDEMLAPLAQWGVVDGSGS